MRIWSDKRYVVGKMITVFGLIARTLFVLIVCRKSIHWHISDSPKGVSQLWPALEALRAAWF